MKDFSNVTIKSLVENGYYKFPDGLLIQWGLSSITGFSTVYLPTSFYNTAYCLVANEQIDSAQSQVYSIHLLSTYTSYFTVRGRFQGLNGAAGDMNDRFYWIAIGRWK